MKMKRLMIAAPKSGSGKTIITCALLQALKNRGEKVVSCKCGPDYIDPMFHKKVIGVPSGNLDTFFTGEECTRMLFKKYAAEGEFAVLEGVMGLYDGLGGIREEGSSYHLAKVTGTPIVLVADARGMGYSLLPLLEGFLAYDTEHLVKGVILNRVSRGHFETLKPLIESKMRLSVLGFLANQEEFHMESRHLGLVMPDELPGIKGKLMRVSEELERTVSLPAIFRIAESAGESGCMETADGREKPVNIEGRPEDIEARPVDAGARPEDIEARPGDIEARPGDTEARPEDIEARPGNIGIRPEDTEERPVIAVARDEVFCFYYEENLLLLEEYGARIRYFSPLHDQRLPDGCHGLLIGGGYPELYAGRLSKNVEMRMSVKQAVKRGMPVVAECGGFMYLHSSLTDKAGIRHAMAGAIPAECFDTGKLVRFGYIEIQDREGYFLPKGGKIKGHEFHYYDSTDNGDSALAIKPATGRSYPCIMEGENYWMGFPHLYYPSNPVFAKAFVSCCSRLRQSPR